MTGQTYSELTTEQRCAHVDTLLKRWRTEGLLERAFGIQPSTFLPVPWHGRVRQHLSMRLVDVSEAIERLARRIDYRPKRIGPPTWPINTGSTISFRKYAPLTISTKEVPTDATQLDNR